MTVRAVLLVLAVLVGGAAPAAAQVSQASADKYNEGQDLFNKRRYAEAVAAFEKAVELDAKNAQAYQAMGLTYQKTRNFDKAVEAFRMATSINPDYVSAHFALGQLSLQALRRYDDAVASFKKVLQLDPNFQEGKGRGFLAAAYSASGQDYFRQRNHRKAAEAFENATQVDPSNAAYFYNLGLARKQSREYAAAISALSSATDLDPKYAKAFKVLGDLYADTRKHSDAASAYNKAIGADPTSAEAYKALALVYGETKQHDRAIATLRKATEADPKDAGLLTTLGYAYHSNKDYRSAIACYRQALSLKPNDDESNYRLAVSLLETKDFGAASAAATKVLSSSKFKVPANVVMGDIYEAQKAAGWKERAIKHWQMGLKDRLYEKYCQDKIERVNNPMAEEGNGQ